MRMRVLVAKPGLDGHDRGARLVARALRDAGVEVVYTGLRQTSQQIVAAAIDEDVTLIGLSVLAGGHLGLARKVVAELAERDADEIQVVIGGVIPDEDIHELKASGVAQVYPSGTPLADIVADIQRVLAEKSNGLADAE